MSLSLEARLALEWMAGSERNAERLRYLVEHFNLNNGE